MDFFDLSFSLGPFIAIAVLFAMAALAFTIWMIVDAIKRPEEDFSSHAAKTGWVAGMRFGLVFGGVGVVIAVVYFFAVRVPAKSRRSPYGHARAVPAPLPSPGSAPPSPPRPASAHCPNCGVKQVTAARFCHSCGHPTG